eukprot:2183170-Amphidinium_carterae.1
MERASAGNIHHMFYFAIAATAATVWPQALRSRAACQEVFMQLYTDMGEPAPLDGLTLRFNEGGKEVIAWEECGVFMLYPDTFPKTHVIHKKSQCRAPLTGLSVTQDLKPRLVQNWSESLAALEVGKSVNTVIKFFEPDVVKEHFQSSCASERVAEKTALVLRSFTETPALTENTLAEHNQEEAANQPLPAQASTAMLPPPPVQVKPKVAVVAKPPAKAGWKPKPPSAKSSVARDVVMPPPKAARTS